MSRAIGLRMLQVCCAAVARGCSAIVVSGTGRAVPVDWRYAISPALRPLAGNLGCCVAREAALRHDRRKP